VSPGGGARAPEAGRSRRYRDGVAPTNSSRTTPAPDAASPGPRSTRQRRALVAELAASEGFRSAQDLHHALREQGEPVGLATIYRALQAMVDSGELDTVKADGNEAVYRLCSPAHHHHLVCRRCGRTVEVSGPAVERWASKVAEEHGFADVDHTLELFGVCQVCRTADAG
jgi:Fur family ferric uptake transcriptional regulator